MARNWVHQLHSGLVALVIVAVLALAPAFAEEPRPMFYNVTTDDAWTAGMSLAQANVAADRGHQVTVFLNVRAVHLADRDAVLGTFGPSGKTPTQLIAALLAKGQTVLVCGTCMKVAGMERADVMDGVTIATPDLTFGALTRPGTIALSY